MTTPNGMQARMQRAEQDIEKLDKEKADAKDVQRLVEEFRSLRHTLQWFMGIVVGAMVASLAVVVAILQAVGS